MALVESPANDQELVGLCDTNLGRLKQRAAWASERGVEVKTYPADDFDRMIAECKPDCVIVTTQDCFHDLYICRAMELGCDVITEKPMTIDAEKCQRIMDTQRATGRKCTRHLQLPLLAAAHPGQGPADVRRDRRGAVGGLSLAAGHAPRRGLLPALAPQQGQLGRADGAQGHPPL